MSCPNVSHHPPPTPIYLWSNSQPRPLFPFLSLFLILSVSRQGLPVRGVEDILEAHRRPADVNPNRGSKTCVRVYLVLRACVFPCTNTHGCVHMCVFLKRGDQLWARGLGETRRAGIMGNETKSNIWKKKKQKTKNPPTFVCFLFLCVQKFQKSNVPERSTRDKRLMRNSEIRFSFIFHSLICTVLNQQQ